MLIIDKISIYSFSNLYKKESTIVVLYFLLWRSIIITVQNKNFNHFLYFCPCPNDALTIKIIFMFRISSNETFCEREKDETKKQLCFKMRKVSNKDCNLHHFLFKPASSRKFSLGRKKKLKTTNNHKIVKYHFNLFFNNRQ